MMTSTAMTGNLMTSAAMTGALVPAVRPVGARPEGWSTRRGSVGGAAFRWIDPVRAFDSRWLGNTRLVAGNSKVVGVADGHNDLGTVNAPGRVPIGAAAIVYTVTVVDPSASGFLSIRSGSSTAAGPVAISWSGGGARSIDGLIVALDGSRQIKVFCGGTGSTHCTIDVTGYFL